MSLIQVSVEGIPKGQPRARAVSIAGKPRMYTPGDADAWRQRVCIALLKHRRERPIEVPVELELTFFLPRPQSHFKKDGTLREGAPARHAQKPDVDNLAKAVMDEISELGIWRDDAQVHLLTVRRCWADGCPPGMVMLLEIE